jgi:hypothetical protein
MSWFVPQEPEQGLVNSHQRIPRSNTQPVNILTGMNWLCGGAIRNPMGNPARYRAGLTVVKNRQLAERQATT